MNSHKTARHRKVMSKPVRYLLNEDLIKGNVLDYGCGRGTDVLELRKLGFQVSGYDPHYLPKMPRRTFSTVLMTYVVNVLASKDAKRAIRSAWKLVAKNGTLFITARSISDVNYEAKRGKWKGDSLRGYITNKGTFQIGYKLGSVFEMNSLAHLTDRLSCGWLEGFKVFPIRTKYPQARTGGPMLSIRRSS